MGNGGVYVGQAPDLLFLEDTNHDDVADTRTVLLTGAGLMLKSFAHMNQRPPGFDPESVIVMKVRFAGPRYGETSAKRAYLREVLTPDPAVREPLTELSRHFVLVAVSSSALSRLDACFEATDLAPLFPPHRRFSAEDSLPTPTSKPDPAIYAFASAQLRLKPGQCLAVEDSVPGAQSACAAGFPTVGNVTFVPPTPRVVRAVRPVSGRASSLSPASVTSVLQRLRALRRGRPVSGQVISFSQASAFILPPNQISTTL